MTCFEVQTTYRCQMINITAAIRSVVREKGLDASAVLITVPHTTAAVTINESADSDVVTDMVAYMSKLVPPSPDFLHFEGNSDAHIKTTLTGSSEMIPVENGELVLGTWQGVFFCEYDGPRTRKVCVSFLM